MLALLAILLYSYPTNVTSMGGFFNWLNTDTNNLYWIAGLFTLFGIMLFTTEKTIPDLLPRTMLAGFVSMLLSLFLISISTGGTALIPAYVPILFGLISGIAAMAWIFNTT
jgi:hypothetical protein